MKKILYINDLYDSYIQKLTNQKLENLNYEQIIDHIHEQRFSWSNILEEKIKKFQFYYIFPNFEFLQKKWLEENNINLKYNSLTDIFIKQLEIISFDLAFFQSISYLKKIKKEKKKINFCFYDGVELNDSNLIQNCKSILTTVKSAKEFYLSKGAKNVFFINHFFDTRIKIKNIKKDYDVTFLGSISNKNHFNRSIFLHKLSKLNKINFFISEKPSWFKIVKICVFHFIKGKKLSNIFQYILSQIFFSKIKKNSFFGLDMFDILSRSKIVLNFHLETVKNDAINMRIYETTGVGSCLLTEYNKNLFSYFNDDEIVTYKDLNDASKKIQYLLDNEHIMKKISEAGRKKTISNFTIDNQIQTIEKFLD